MFGKADQYHLYDICAFSQHYMNSSPLIDFTKSPDVALSFALKGKEAADNDAIIYTVEITNEDNYTTLWYDFDMLMDISSAVRLAFRAQRQD